MNSRSKKIILTSLAAIVTLFHLIPFYIVITTSLKKAGDFSSKWLLPDYFTLENFTEAWEEANLGNALTNSVIITFFAALILIFFGSLAAYPLARRQTKINNFVYFLFISVMVIPPLTALVPLYNIIVDFGLMDTHLVAILNNAASFTPLTIFLYTGFIRSTVPIELEEAARMEGAGTIKIFFRVVFPLLKPITATVMIITCVYIWNDFQFALFFLQDADVQTYTVALSSFFGENSNNLSLVAAASMISMLPMTILFLFLQRYFIAGLAAGSVKG